MAGDYIVGILMIYLQELFVVFFFLGEMVSFEDESISSLEIPLFFVVGVDLLLEQQISVIVPIFNKKFINILMVEIREKENTV